MVTNLRYQLLIILNYPAILSHQCSTTVSLELYSGSQSHVINITGVVSPKTIQITLFPRSFFFSLASKEGSKRDPENEVVI